MAHRLVPLMVGLASAAPLKVYLLLGQSNMEGQGLVGPPEKNGSLSFAVATPRPEGWPVVDIAEAASERVGYDAKGADFSDLVDDKTGNFSVNPRCYVDYWGKVGEDWGSVRRGYLEPGFGAGGVDRVGPELGFGTTVGKESKVLLLKIAWGGTALATDWRPPRSGGTVGWAFANATEHAKAALENISAVFPDYDPSEGYDLVGWTWHQGWNDGCSVNMSAEYEFNLANLIRDLDEAFGKKLLATVAVQGTSGGWDHQPSRRLEVIRAQYNVSTYDEFEGRVASVETRGFWRDFAETDDGACNQGYHWNCNAASYYFIGTVAAQAMRKLEQGTWTQPFINSTNDADTPADFDDFCPAVASA